MTKRVPTHVGDRNEDRRHRPRVDAVPTELPDDITGQYEGEELREYRSRRPTIERIQRLEDHKDQSIAMFATVSTKLETLVKHAESAESYRQKREEMEHDAKERERTRRWVLALIAGIVTAVVTLIGALR